MVDETMTTRWWPQTRRRQDGWMAGEMLEGVTLSSKGRHLGLGEANGESSTVVNERRTKTEQLGRRRVGFFE
ncbi:hypothetical protein Csa_020281 [Cucumis sativus]|uniref:Uncharacterized protein n=1 Tax=Cucumis sativus TaxID=3659 RepID=A0A0A0K8G3_CUCSA|nr:hypothetical protein Csa_020281 [Cucumis sativus]